MSPARAKRIVLEGNLTIYEAAALKDKVLSALQGSTGLELDVSQVPEIDTAGVQLLVLLQREARAAGKPLRLVGSNQLIGEVFSLLSLGDLIEAPK
jgi:anti-sigma B factor antagonist